MMTNALRTALTVLSLALLLVACSGQTDAADRIGPPSEEQVVDTAWEALEPNTSSHDRANWRVSEARQVTGQEVVEEFEGRIAYGCPGPKPPDNGEIKSSQTYWYVQFERRPATPLPEEGTVSPTAPPMVPEPFMYQALFLINADGQVVARKLFCVIY